MINSCKHKRELIVILYWIFAGFSFVWVHYEINKVPPSQISIFTLFIIAFLIFGLYNKHNIFALAFICFVALICISYWTHLNSSYHTWFCIASTLFFILAYKIILDSEKVDTSKSKNINLIHNRYLGYFKTSTYIMAVALAYLGILLRPENLPGDVNFPTYAKLAQIILIFSLGILLLVCAFTTKLREIEKQAKDD